MAQPAHDWLDDEPIPPELMDTPEGFDDGDRLIDEAFQMAESSEIELAQAVEMVADAEPERWRILDDESAEWALRHLATAEAQIEALRVRSVAWQEKIEAWFTQAAKEPARSAEFFAAHLELYGRRVRRDEGRKSVALPSGKIKTRVVAAGPVITDADGLLAWARDMLPAVVRVREDVLVSELARATQLAGGRVVTPEGEVVPGTEVRPERVTVTVEPGA